MQIKNSGQASIGITLIVGIVLALILYYGYSRNAVMQGMVTAQDAKLIANDTLAAAARKMQQLYAIDSGCDPDVFEARVNSLPAAPGGGYNGFSYVVADIRSGLTADQRVNRCATATGCRQIPVDQNNRALIVTVGLISSLDRPGGMPAGERCSRDTTIKLKVAIRGQAFSRRYTLINTCSFTSCAGGSFAGATGNQATGINTTACGVLTARPYGDIVGTAGAPDGVVDEHELRWARKYLESGGFDAGGTTYIGATVAAGNGSCSAGTGGCVARSCVTYFDLNRDGTNNESDLAILEYYLRGYIPELPIRDF